MEWVHNVQFFTRTRLPIVAIIAALFGPIVLATENGRDVKVEVQPDGFPKKFTFKAKNLYEHAAFLASDECEGRLAGSPGQAIAREYIIKRLKKIGFENVWQQEFD